MLIAAAVLFAVSIQSQLEKLSTPDPDWPFQPTYVKLSKTRIAAAILDAKLDGVIVMYRVDQRGDLREIMRIYADDRVRGMEAVDLDGDGQKEFMYSGTPGNRGGRGYTFVRWDAKSLRKIGEAGDPRLVDLDHDGILETVETHHCHSGADECSYSVCTTVQRMKSGAYERDETDYASFDEWKLPSDEIADFQSSMGIPGLDQAVHVVLHIINGDRGGKHRVDALELEVDDKPVKVHINRHVEFLDIPVIFASHCSGIVATLHGHRGAVVRLLVELKEKSND